MKALRWQCIECKTCSSCRDQGKNAVSTVRYGLNEEDISLVDVLFKLQNKIILESSICSFCLRLVVFLRPVKYHDMSVVENYVRVL